MISDITLGQFFPGYSVIHKLDPRTKILLAVMFIVTVFLAVPYVKARYFTKIKKPAAVKSAVGKEEVGDNGNA